MKKFIVLLCILLLPGCSVLAEAETEDAMIQNMTIEERVAQLFFITPEALVGLDQVTAAGPTTQECFDQYPVGGLIYFAQNIESRDQLTQMLGNTQEFSRQRTGLPVFLAVDEEGGSVTRVYGSGVDNIPYVGDMLSIVLSGDTESAYQTGLQIGSYLSELNFNVDFAPVADIFSNQANTIIGDRSFGYDADTVAAMVPETVKGMLDAGVQPTLKHFPGHGDTVEDSHAGYAYSYRTLEELRASEFVPFKAGIEAGANFVMVGHISLPNILSTDTPSSLSYTVVTGMLREELGFQGVIVTDALNMGAVSNYYSSGEAAVQAFLAGVDMLLMPVDFQSAYDAVLNAVYDGTITEERLNESVERILAVKLSMMQTDSEE